jgi:hypothetical protein
VSLTADLDIGSLGEIGWHGTALVLAIMFLARPAAIMLATTGAKMQFNERLLLSWIAPRGIVAAATAGLMGPRLVDAGYDAKALLPLVFAIIFATVFSHGLTINWLARHLSLSSRHRDGALLVGSSPWTVALARVLRDMKVNVLVADTSWHNLREARLAGIPVFYGEILSEFAEESVELAHVRTVLAATRNDAYNALVCTALAPEIGQRHVLQLAMGSGDSEEDPKALARPRRGGVAFDAEADYESLWRNLVRGWKFTKTRLSENYNYEALLNDRGDDGIEILTMNADGDITFITSERSSTPEAGVTVVWFAPEKNTVAPGKSDVETSAV